MQTSHPLKSYLLGVSAIALVTAATPALAQQAPDSEVSVIEELVVTAQRRSEALQDVPIAVSAFTQDTLDAQGIEGGPDLQQTVPNVSFSRGNYTGFNFQIRGIGSKVVAGSGDAGVGIHLNNSPLTASRLFEAEFYDVERVEVLRGPQGTLYGRNATGGVVNVITNKPTDTFEGMIRGEYGNYNTVRLKGMINLPFNDLVALRLAGSYLKRDGFGHNLTTGNAIDDRDLNAFRATLGFNTGGEGIRAYLSYEHFEEDDHRARAGKQICRKDVGPASVGGVAVGNPFTRGLLSQSCLPSRIGSPESLGTINSIATLFGPPSVITGLLPGDAFAGRMQTPDLRTVESAFDPQYRAQSDIYQLSLDLDITESLTLSSLTAYNKDGISSFLDYFRTAPSVAFNPTPVSPGGVLNDPQLGASNLLRAYDISQASSDQFSHELRLSSSFEGPLNFSVGAIYLNYESNDPEYFVFSNALTAAARAGFPATGVYVDPSPLTNLVGDGHNYFLSTQPYDLKSTAAFGEAYYQLLNNLKITGGLRYTKDEKTVVNNPVSLLAPGRGFNISPVGPTGAALPLNAYVNIQSAEFSETTGRLTLDWQPELSFTDETLIYASYARGYKAGGLNPPQSAGLAGVQSTFAPELVDAIEVGTKNTLFGGRLILNLTGFHYGYKGYQVSRIVNRTSINDNVDAKVRGFELETTVEPIRSLRFNANLGLLDTEIEEGSLIDIFDRLQGQAGYTYVGGALSGGGCLAPTVQLAQFVAVNNAVPAVSGLLINACNGTLRAGTTAATGNPLAAAGVFLDVIQGFPVDLAGKELPNSPKTTFSAGMQYTFEFGDSWSLIPRIDYFYQGKTFARIYNAPTDRLASFENINLNLRLENRELGLMVEAYVRNATDEEAITDAFLNDEASGLYRNIFLTEPRTYGLAITKVF